MSRWLRALVIALLIPAYGLAAAGVAVFAQVASGDGQVLIEGHQNPESLDDEFAGNVADLAFELGDTSDDAAELPTTAPALPPAVPAPSAALCAPDPRPPANTPDPLLRPPKSASLRA
jgi:hypothetical protein